MIFVRLSNTFVDLSKQNSKAMEIVMYTKNWCESMSSFRFLTHF